MTINRDEFGKIPETKWDRILAAIVKDDGVVKILMKAKTAIRFEYNPDAIENKAAYIQELTDLIGLNKKLKKESISKFAKYLEQK